MDFLVAFLVGMFFLKGIGRFVLFVLDWLTMNRFSFKKWPAGVHVYDGEKLVGAGVLLLLIIFSRLMNW